MKKLSKNIKTVLQILEDEKNGDVKSALQKMANNYLMTWVYKTKSGELFPKTKKDFQKELADVYKIRNRQYDIKNVAENDNVVMVELIESYVDPNTKEMYRTPLVLVLEMESGKIKKGRHYCDPQLSYLHLSEEQIQKIFE